MIYSVIQGSYELNKSFVIENFCVNKEKPELKCDGKCFLAQQLKAEKERQEKENTFKFSQDFGQFIIADTPSFLNQVFENHGKEFLVLRSEDFKDFFSLKLHTPPKI